MASRGGTLAVGSRLNGAVYTWSKGDPPCDPNGSTVYAGHAWHDRLMSKDLIAAAAIKRVREAETDSADERSRRLESDADAVQVLTSHMSKGLEFPVVLAPSLWSHWSPTPAYPRFHDEGGVRTDTIFVMTGGGPGNATQTSRPPRRSER